MGSFDGKIDTWVIYELRVHQNWKTIEILDVMKYNCTNFERGDIRSFSLPCSAISENAHMTSVH